MLPEKTESDEILTVINVFDDKQENEFLIRCPHCGYIRGVEKEASLRGLGREQYQDNLCDGWYEISTAAKLVDSVEKL